ncbi:MAG: hypothetical protein HZA23_07350 [Nitrospirae bacterium]|nr:hypothetical protein [Nitrospirota bacterium]
MIGLFLLVPGSVLLYLASDTGPNPSSVSHNRQRNGIWLQHAWFSEPQTAQRLAELGSQLREHGMRDLYLHVGPLNEDGGIPPYPPEVARTFLGGIREAVPGVRVFAWLGGIPVGSPRGKVDLQDETVTQAIADRARELTTLGFDGVHLNIEPIEDGDPAFLALLERVKGALGEGKLLSVAAMKWKPFNLPHPWFRKWFWISAYFRDVGRTADQVVVMAYDTAIPFRRLYAWFVKQQTIQVTRALDEESASGGAPRCEVLIGLPTYDRATRVYDPEVENLEQGIRGVIAGLEDERSAREVFAGIAIYAHWVTDEQEWAVYRQLWGNQGAQEGG